MKPRVFIGSTSEKLDTANAIQMNLENDSQPTVWSQGIFKLSQGTLESLMDAVNNFDFAIFVFSPDDVTQIRNAQFATVRDNLIFELGLFMGKLGRERVFFLVPKSVDKLHLPSDLLGITHGTYDSKREDGNVAAAVAPFCSQGQKSFKNFVIENLSDVQDEPDSIKRILVDKPRFWEYKFMFELLAHRLEPLNRSHSEIDAGLLVQKVKVLNADQFLNWYSDTLANLSNLIEVLEKSLKSINEPFGPPGVPAKPLEMKNAADRLIQICKEMLNWHAELNSLIVPSELEEVKQILRGWANMFIHYANSIEARLRQGISRAEGQSVGPYEIDINLEPIKLVGAERILELFTKSTRPN